MLLLIINISLGCKTTKSLSDNSFLYQYLSDKDSTYKAIEEFQKIYTNKNYILTNTGKEHFTRESAYNYVRSLDSLEKSLMGTQKEGTEALMSKLFDEYIPELYPTRYQDPLQFTIYARLIGDIHKSAKIMYPFLNYTPKYGTFYTNTILAERKTTKNDYLLLIHSKYVAFCHQMGKVALQIYKNSKLSNGCFKNSIDTLEVSKYINDDEEIPINFLYTFLEFNYNSFPINDSLTIGKVSWLQKECIQKAIQYWNNACETFLIGHEYSHALLRHTSGDSDFQTDTIILKSWYNEVEADSVSQSLLTNITLNNKNDRYNVGWNKYILYGGLFYLNTMKVFENGQSILNTNKESYVVAKDDFDLMLSILKNKNDLKGNLEKFKKLNLIFQKQDHPPIEIRLELIRQQIIKNLDSKIFDDVELDSLEDKSKELADRMIFSLDKMNQRTNKAFHNTYLVKDLLNEKYNK